MKGLLLKDFYLIKSQGKFFLLFFLLFGGICIVSDMDSSFFAGFALMLTVSLSVSTFSYDDLAHWNKYAAATPAGRRGVVQAKYLFTLLMVCIIAAVVVLFTALYCAVQQEFSQFFLSLASGAVCTALGLLISLVLLPLLFKFGAEKSRLMLILGMGAVALGAFGLQGLEQSGRLPANLPDWLLASLPLIGAGIVAITFVVSYSVSLRIYSKKEL